jgi:hypothetical protein
MDLNLCLKKINVINSIETEKKNKIKKIKKKKEKIEKISHDLKEYLMMRRNEEFKNNLRLKSKREAEKNDKEYTGDKKEFFKKLDEQQNKFFLKKWTSLSKHIKINRINKYFKDNKINDEKYLFDLKKLIEDKKLKNYVIYNDIEGLIETIKDIYNKMNWEEEYKKLQQCYEKNLKKYGVRLPGKESNYGYALTFLFKNINKSYKTNEIKDILVKTGKEFEGADSLQLRHLSTQYGWNIVKDGRYKFKLVSITEKAPKFISDKRKIKLNKKNWEELKKEYGNKCACCKLEKKLQQGHMDPRKSLTLDNCIPQCADCNQSATNRYKFDKNGVKERIIEKPKNQS